MDIDRVQLEAFMEERSRGIVHTHTWERKMRKIAAQLDDEGDPLRAWDSNQNRFRNSLEILDDPAP